MATAKKRAAKRGRVVVERVFDSHLLLANGLYRSELIERRTGNVVDACYHQHKNEKAAISCAVQMRARMRRKIERALRARKEGE